jgi:ribonuclease PH
MGQTRVVCSASVEEKQPPFLQDKNSGWVTAEYGMLPRSTLRRSSREAIRGSQGGRTQEIQRLVGRSLRAVVDLAALGPRTIWLDCDCIQADGGTRTASITGAFVALVEALGSLRRQGAFLKLPLKDFVAATSVGLVNSQPLLDLTYDEDSRAQVDMNVVMTGKGEFVEIQGTGEGSTFSEAQMQQLLQLAKGGIRQLIEAQRNTLKDLL